MDGSSLRSLQASSCIRARPRSVLRLAVHVAVIANGSSKQTFAHLIHNKAWTAPAAGLAWLNPLSLSFCDVEVLVVLEAELVEGTQMQRLLDPRHGVW